MNCHDIANTLKHIYEQHSASAIVLKSARFFFQITLQWVRHSRDLILSATRRKPDRRRLKGAKSRSAARSKALICVFTVLLAVSRAPPLRPHHLCTYHRRHGARTRWTAAVSSLLHKLLCRDHLAMSSVIPHVPISIDDECIENGSRIILKHIRPDWDLDKIRYKVRKTQCVMFSIGIS